MSADPIPALQVADLRMRYALGGGAPALEVLRGVNLRVQPGESVAVLGPSGSGKSTLLGLLAGLDRPSSGNITVAGEDLAKASHERLAAVRAQRIGFVFQSHRLLPMLSALENARVPLDLLGRRDSATRAAALLTQLGLGERLHHLPGQLSGGEQQRVAIARALVAAPALVLADEPTGNLDRSTADQVAGLLLAAAKDHGAALVLVTHDTLLAARCDRTLRMADGLLHPQAA